MLVGRKAKKQAQSSTSKIQDLKDHEVVQRFFLQEVILYLLTVYQILDD